MQRGITFKTGMPSNASGKNQLRIDPSVLLTSVPSPPEDLDEVGIDFWNYICEIFVNAGLLSKLFIPSIHNLCKYAMIVSSLEKQLTRQGLTVKKTDRNGNTTLSISPATDKLLAYYAKMDSLFASLGMTPCSARANQIDSSGGASKGKVSSPPTIGLFSEN